MNVRPTLVAYALLACSLVAYLGMLVQARHEYAGVVDTIVYGGTLASNGERPTNTAFDPTNGSASLGVNYRLVSKASWTIVPVHRSSSAMRWLYVTAETPQFFSRSAAVRLTLDGIRLGEIYAVRAGGPTGFLADRNQKPIAAPPERTFGYRFPLAGSRSCSNRPCMLEIRGNDAFWHVYRFAIIGVTPRFAVSNAR